MPNIPIGQLIYTTSLVSAAYAKTKRKNKMVETNLEKVGALWQNTASDGKQYFNLDLEGQKYVVFSNGFKQEEKQPDFLVYERVKEKGKKKAKKVVA